MHYMQCYGGITYVVLERVHLTERQCVRAMLQITQNTMRQGEPV